MEPFSFLLIISALFNVAFAGRHATLTKEELHWKSVFPDTPMPKVLHDILPRPGQNTIFRGKVAPDIDGDSTYDNSYNQMYGSGVNDDQDSDYDNSYNQIYGGGVSDDQDSDYDNSYNQIYGDNSDKESKGKEYNYGNISNIKETMFFFQEYLRPGKKLNLPRLTQRSNRALFLPQQIAKSMPMSTDKIPEILKNFSFKADSSYAKGIRRTITNCERAAIRGEEKYCATFFESFVDLGISLLGKNIKPLSHQLGNGLRSRSFTISRGVRAVGDNSIVCHKMNYPYAVYLCHSIKKTTVYEVPLVSKDGTKSNALAVCHKDTSAWSPNHISFQYLNVKPGSVPICHVLAKDIIVWVTN